MALDLNDLTQDQQFAKAAEFSGVPESVLRGMWRVESGEGTNMRSEAGARGHFQTMPATQATWEKRTGRTYNPDDFADSITLAALTMRENMALAGGDVDIALAIYHGGTNRRNWGERTLSYAGKVRGAPVNQGAAFSGTADLSTTPRGVSFDEAWKGTPFDRSSAALLSSRGKEYLSDFEKGVIDNAGGVAAAAATLAGREDATGVALQFSRAAHDNLQAATSAYIENMAGEGARGDESAITERLIRRAEFAAIENQNFAESQGLLDYWGAAFSSTLTGQAMRMYQNMDTDKGYEPGWRYIDHIDEIETPDMTARERAMLREANSPAEVEFYKKEIEQQRHDARVLGTMGTTGQVTWSLVGGVTDPMGWAAGYGVGKAASLVGVGTRAYVAAGRPVAALAASSVEGAVGNVVTGAALEAMGAYRTTGDYIEDAGIGLLMGGVLGGPSAYRANQLANELISEGAKRRVEVAVKAQELAGPDASEAQLHAAIRQVEADEDLKWMQAVFGDVQDQDRLMARPDVGPRVQAAEPEIVPDRFVAAVRDGEEFHLKVTRGKIDDVETISVEVVDENGELLKDSLGRDVGRVIASPQGGKLSVRVSPEFQRRGIATALYRVAGESGADLGDAQTGQFASGGTATRSEEGQAFRAGTDIAQAQVRPLTQQGDPARAEAASVFARPKERKALIERFGLKNRIPDKATRAQIAEVIGRAIRTDQRNAIDPERLKTLLAKGDLEATSTTLLSSESPVARAIGIMLMENPEGAAGRRATASLSRSQFFDQYLGTTNRDVMSAYDMWAKDNQIGMIRANMDGETQSRFFRQVAAEMDRRWNKRPEDVNVHPMVKLAADVYDNGYHRMGRDQKYVGVVGAERIDLTTSGYFQRVWNLGKVAEMARTEAGMQSLIDMFEDQFRVVAGFGGEEFPRELAVQYVQRLVHRAAGTVEVPMHLFSNDTALILRESLTALKLNEEEIQKVVSRFSRGGASHTKGRIDMDLSRTYTDGAGRSFSALDLMDHNLPDLYRRYASRVAGDVALAKHGILGDAGIKTLREALVHTGGTPKELRAYDQFMSEMVGRKVGDGDPTILQNARVLTGATRLGGAVFPQLGAYLDGMIALGAGRVLKAVAGMPRLMSEVRAIAAGKTVDNPILSGLETLGGAGGEFGLSDYRIQGMFDVGESFEVYGKETLGVLSKAIRASGHGVRIMSGHRATVAVQTRGMAEQIVQKAWRYIREGKDDAALEDMGFNANMRAALRKHMDEVTEWDDAGNLKVFDPARVSVEGAQLMIAFRDAVYRGAGQIIQREFPGEVGKWAHSGFLKLLFQFRTFSLVAHQKQLGRQFAVHGNAKAFGFLIGAMSIAMPIHLSRVLLRVSLLPEAEREEYLKENTGPLALARASMNYVGALGIMPDVLDLTGGLSAGWADTAGVDLPEWLKSTGGRTMAQTDIIGGQFAPAVGVVNDLGQGIFGSPRKLVRSLPGNNLPYLQPLWLAGESELKD